jgi:hypothetical protein
MSGQHTPGPWLLDQSAEMSSISASGADGEYIGITYMTLPNHEANASLIAAAPDLLEALRDMVTYGHETHGTQVLLARKAARAAIAKATGAA